MPNISLIEYDYECITHDIVKDDRSMRVSKNVTHNLNC